MTPWTQARWQRPDAALLRLRRLLAALALGPAGLAGTAVVGVLRGPAGAVAVLLLAGALLALALVVLERRYLSWGYAERAEDLLVRRGVLVRRLSVVPYGRMQYVDVTAGPLERRYDLATVTLHTAAAASDARVPGLRSAEAARLRDRLTALGEARTAGV